MYTQLPSAFSGTCQEEGGGAIGIDFFEWAGLNHTGDKKGGRRMVWTPREEINKMKQANDTEVKMAVALCVY